MTGYVARRVAQMVLVLAGATFVLFACLFVVPGDPVASLGGKRARDPVVREELTRRYHLDESLPAQYGHYVARLVHGDLGRSYRLDRPVRDLLGEKVWASTRLAVAAMGFEVVIGIGAGLVSVLARRRFWDVAVTLTTTLLFGLPMFVIGLVFQETFSQRLGWFPLAGADNGLASYVLPAASLAVIDAALVARLLRGSMIEVLRADYIRTAVAKGISERRVMVAHVLRNSLIPVVTYLGIAFGSLLAGALIAEVIFNWDGLGAALATAVSTQDNPVVMGVVTYGVVAFVATSLAVDLVLAVLDPRVRVSR